MIPDNPITRQERYLDAIANGTAEVPEPITREEEYLAYIALNGGGGGGGTKNYNALQNRPQVNGHTLSGDMSTSDLEITAAGLADTDISNPAAGESLIYDGTKWSNGTGIISEAQWTAITNRLA
jgi:hypothetical protein